MTATAINQPVLIRPATSADAGAIARLAALDSQRVPSGDLLLGEVGGELQAAVRVRDGAVIADPFSPTADLVALLRERAEHLSGRRARTVRGAWMTVARPSNG
jgi:hypothetical protein